MNSTKSFTRFTAICCGLTVITTLGIHLFFPAPPAGFEERALLFRDNIYLLNRWWVILHCLLVIISMWGVALVVMKRSPGFAGIGFLFFCVFTIAEIYRQLYVFFYLNDLRQQYAMASDPVIKETLRPFLQYAGLQAAPLFGLFILSFGLGNLCYGMTLVSEKRYSKILGILLLLWGAGSLLAFGNHFWQKQGVDNFLEIYNFTYQPLMRLLIAGWLWKQSGEALRTNTLS